MSGRKLYRVEWVNTRAASPSRRSRIFAQRRAAVVFFFTVRRLGASAVIFSAPLPEWEPLPVSDKERRQLREAIAWSTKRRRASRDRARQRWGR